MGKLSQHLKFIDFGDICKNCNVNCCKRFYAVLLPEEEEEFKDVAFTLETGLGPVKCLGYYNGRACPFLSKDGLCLNYQNRPFDCRIWPVIMYYDFKTEEKVIYLDMECPAVVEGRIDQGIINRIIKALRELTIDEEWIKKYTIAPWPNNLKEIMRWK